MKDLGTRGRSERSGIGKREAQLPCELGIGSREESIEVLGEDEAEGRKTLEVIEQSTLAGVLEALRCVTLGVVEKLQAVLVGLLGGLRPEGPDEPFGAGTQEGGVVENELLGSGEIGVGRRVFPIESNAHAAISVG
jgi:hypothetical protein